MATSSIEWTDVTWNPITGCDPISPGCANCYAARMAKRLQAMGQHRYRDGFAVRFHHEALYEPLRWRKPRRCFVCSMGDLFHKDVTDEQIAAVFGVIAACPAHQFMILTKRAERMREWFEWTTKKHPVPMQPAVREHHGVTYERLRVVWEAWRNGLPTEDWLPHVYGTWPLPNVWLGVTAENQEQADKRIPLLLNTPAAVRFVSVEPMLEAVELAMSLPTPALDETGYRLHANTNQRIDLVICGAETGPRRRTCELDWTRSLRDQCVAADVPFFLKALMVDGKRVSMPKLDGRTWYQMPEVKA